MSDTPIRWGAGRVDPASLAAADARFMRDALALGRRGLGRTAPNPAVGALIVRDPAGEARIVGRGWTQPGGRPHAEAMAIGNAGVAAVGATMYVTLEPCAHRSVRGATPCAERTMLSGVRRVVSSIDDPNPHIAGLGHALLRSFGVAVAVGEGRDEALRDHRGHILRVTGGRPLVTLKLAATADGFAASAGPQRLLITGPSANARVHLMRAAHDAILVGVETVIADDPRLDVRLAGLEDRSPRRVVLDSRLRIPAHSRLVATARERPLTIVAAEDAPTMRENALVAAGAEIWRVRRDAAGRADLAEALRLLAAVGVTRLFCEGGPTLADALAAAGLVDEAVLLRGEARLGAAGLPALGPALAAALAGPGFRKLRTERLGADSLEHWERARSCSPGS